MRNNLTSREGLPGRPCRVPSASVQTPEYLTSLAGQLCTHLQTRPSPPIALTRARLRLRRRTRNPWRPPGRREAPRPARPAGVTTDGAEGPRPTAGRPGPSPRPPGTAPGSRPGRQRRGQNALINNGADTRQVPREAIKSRNKVVPCDPKHFYQNVQIAESTVSRSSANANATCSKPSPRQGQRHRRPQRVPSAAIHPRPEGGWRGPLRLPEPKGPWDTFAEPAGSGPRAPSDLREGEPVGAGGLLDLQLEGVLVGVVLHDVVVHVHQDPAGREATRVHPPPPALQSEPDRPASPPPTRCAAGGNLFQPLHASSSPSERQVQ